LLHPGDATRVQHGGAAVPRGPHPLRRAALSAAALACLVLAAPASAQPSGIAPYRYDPPYGASPLDREKARVYQDQLRHDIPREPATDATTAARQRELLQERDRVDRLLQSPPPPPPVTFARPPEERGPVTSSGGHPQPTPAEIEERRRRQERRGSPAVPLRPVYDLFGERLQ
jgi:hypothetical protein